MSKKNGEKGLKWRTQHRVVVLIVTLIAAGGLTACNNSPAPVIPTGAAVAQLSQTPGSTPTCEPPTAQINSNVVSEGVAGQQVALVAAASGTDLAYSWSVSAGTLSDSSSATVIYTLPPDAGKVVITLRVDSSCGSAEDVLSLDVVTPTHTPTATPTRTATPTVTSTKTPMPRPSSTPIPQSRLVLLQPVGNECIGTAPNMVFKWDYAPGLNNIRGIGGQYYALNIWSSSTPKQSINWIKDPWYEVSLKPPVVVFTHEVDCSKEEEPRTNGCYWSVDVIKSYVDEGGGWQEGSYQIIASSNTRSFCVRREHEVQPPPPPPPPPCDLPPDECPKK
jgi:hypothetical protein